MGAVDLRTGQVPTWNTLSIAEQTLIRAAVSGARLAGTVQTYGAAMRWAGMPGVPPRSYTDDEQCRLVPQLADVAMTLATGGLLSIVRRRHLRGEGEVLLSGEPLRHVLAEPANWIWNPSSANDYTFRAAQQLRDRWSADVYPVVDTADFPAWEQLSREQREVLVCAAESSGMLTGAFGIWTDPPSELQGADRQAWIEEQLAPLLFFVRAGLIEVRHFPDDSSDAYSVVPVDALGQTLADPAVRESEDWGVGVGCVFTYDGLAVWRNAWSGGWNSRLRLD
jgi:hypothetical protein